MKVNKNCFLVRIDKAAQNIKRNMIGGFFIPENYQDMAHNLQYGEIVEIGYFAKNKFPEAEIGDILFFHHFVEYKPRTDGDKLYADNHLVDVLENKDELRIANISHEVFGIIKKETHDIIPYEDFIFCHENFKKADFLVTSTGLYLPDSWNETEQQLMDRLDELKLQIDTLRGSVQYKNKKENYKEIEQIEKSISLINKERETITKKIHEEKYVETRLLYINNSTKKEFGLNLKAGDIVYAHSFALYPLDIDGVHFVVINKRYCAAAKKDGKIIPFYNKVFISPDSEDACKSGIIVPDNFLKRKNIGTVEMRGSAAEEIKENDRVVFLSTAGIDVEISGKKMILMNETDILFRINRGELKN